MITLRTLEIETEADVEALVTNLQLSTERLEIGPLNFSFFFFKKDVSRHWLGQIDRKHRRFKLVRNKERSGIGLRLSRIVSHGQIIEGTSKHLIKINLQPSGPVFFNELWLTVATIFGIVLIPLDILVEYWWVLLIWALMWIPNFIFLAIDLKKTEDKLVEYFDKQGPDA